MFCFLNSTSYLSGNAPDDFKPRLVGLQAIIRGHFEAELSGKIYINFRPHFYAIDVHNLGQSIEDAV